MSHRQAAHVKESSAYRHRRTETEFSDRRTITIAG